MTKKAMSKKVYIAIFLLVILVGIAVAAIVYTTQTSSSSVVPGVNVGDTFTYKLMGYSVLFNSTAVTPAYLSEYNNTDYYQVNITGIKGSVVSFDTVWKFTNGTAIQNSEWVNLATGNNSGVFWAIYPSNLNANNMLYPKEANTGLIVNSTGSQTYSTGTRQTNYWSIENVFTYIKDPTGNTRQDILTSLCFDKQTGMLVDLTNIQYYNNPYYNIIITWQLTNSTVWGV